MRGSLRAVQGTSGFDLFGGGIKSLQSGITTLSSATTNITITNVDLTKSFVLISFKGTAKASDDDGYAYSQGITKAVLTSSTNLELSCRSQSSYYTTTVSWFIIELEAIKNVQRGVSHWGIGSTSLDINIAGVDLSKTIIIATASGWPVAPNVVGAAIFGVWKFLTKLTSPTVLRLENTVNIANKGLDVAWQVIEFN